MSDKASHYKHLLKTTKKLNDRESKSNNSQSTSKNTTSKPTQPTSKKSQVDLLKEVLATNNNKKNSLLDNSRGTYLDENPIDTRNSNKLNQEIYKRSFEKNEQNVYDSIRKTITDKHLISNDDLERNAFSADKLGLDLSDGTSKEERELIKQEQKDRQERFYLSDFGLDKDELKANNVDMNLALKYPSDTKTFITENKLDLRNPNHVSQINKELKAIDDNWGITNVAKGLVTPNKYGTENLKNNMSISHQKKSDSENLGMAITRSVNANIGNLSKSAQSVFEDMSRKNTTPLAKGINKSIADFFGGVGDNTLQRASNYSDLDRPKFEGITETSQNPRWWSNLIGEQIPNVAMFSATAGLGGAIGKGTTSLLMSIPKYANLTVGKPYVNALVQGGVATVSSTGISATMESAMEAGQMYEMAMGTFGDHEKAKTLADEVFTKNMALISLSNGLQFGSMFVKNPLLKSIAVGSSPIAEGMQEYGQQYIQTEAFDDATDNKLGDGYESFSNFREDNPMLQNEAFWSGVASGTMSQGVQGVKGAVKGAVEGVKKLDLPNKFSNAKNKALNKKDETLEKAKKTILDNETIKKIRDNDYTMEELKSYQQSDNEKVSTVANQKSAEMEEFLSSKTDKELQSFLTERKEVLKDTQKRLNESDNKKQSESLTREVERLESAINHIEKFKPLKESTTQNTEKPIKQFQSASYNPKVKNEVFSDKPNKTKDTLVVEQLVDNMVDKINTNFAKGNTSFSPTELFNKISQNEISGLPKVSFIETQNKASTNQLALSGQTLSPLDNLSTVTKKKVVKGTEKYFSQEDIELLKNEDFRSLLVNRQQQLIKEEEERLIPSKDRTIKVVNKKVGDELEFVHINFDEASRRVKENFKLKMPFEKVGFKGKTLKDYIATKLQAISDAKQDGKNYNHLLQELKTIIDTLPNEQKDFERIIENYANQRNTDNHKKRKKINEILMEVLENASYINQLSGVVHNKNSVSEFKSFERVIDEAIDEELRNVNNAKTIKEKEVNSAEAKIKSLENKIIDKGLTGTEKEKVNTEIINLQSKIDKANKELKTIDDKISNWNEIKDSGSINYFLYDNDDLETIIARLTNTVINADEIKGFLKEKELATKEEELAEIGQIIPNYLMYDNDDLETIIARLTTTVINADEIKDFLKEREIKIIANHLKTVEVLIEVEVANKIKYHREKEILTVLDKKELSFDDVELHKIKEFISRSNFKIKNVLLSRDSYLERGADNKPKFYYEISLEKKLFINQFKDFVDNTTKKIHTILDRLPNAKDNKRFLELTKKYNKKINDFLKSFTKEDIDLVKVNEFFTENYRNYLAELSQKHDEHDGKSLVDIYSLIKKLDKELEQILKDIERKKIEFYSGYILFDYFNNKLTFKNVENIFESSGYYPIRFPLDIKRIGNYEKDSPIVNKTISKAKGNFYYLFDFVKFLQTDTNKFLSDKKDFEDKMKDQNQIIKKHNERLEKERPYKEIEKSILEYHSIIDEKNKVIETAKSKLSKGLKNDNNFWLMPSTTADNIYTNKNNKPQKSTSELTFDEFAKKHDLNELKNSIDSIVEKSRKYKGFDDLKVSYNNAIARIKNIPSEEALDKEIDELISVEKERVLIYNEVLNTIKQMEDITTNTNQETFGYKKAMNYKGSLSSFSKLLKRKAEIPYENLQEFKENEIITALKDLIALIPKDFGYLKSKNRDEEQQINLSSVFNEFVFKHEGKANFPNITEILSLSSGNKQSSNGERKLFKGLKDYSDKHLETLELFLIDKPIEVEAVLNIEEKLLNIIKKSFKDKEFDDSQSLEYGKRVIEEYTKLEGELETLPLYLETIRNAFNDDGTLINLKESDKVVEEKSNGKSSVQEKPTTEKSVQEKTTTESSLKEIVDKEIATVLHKDSKEISLLEIFRFDTNKDLFYKGDLKPHKYKNYLKGLENRISKFLYSTTTPSFQESLEINKTEKGEELNKVVLDLNSFIEKFVDDIKNTEDENFNQSLVVYKSKELLDKFKEVDIKTLDQDLKGFSKEALAIKGKQLAKEIDEKKLIEENTKKEVKVDVVKTITNELHTTYEKDSKDFEWVYEAVYLLFEQKYLNTYSDTSFSNLMDNYTSLSAGVPNSKDFLELNIIKPLYEAKNIDHAISFIHLLNDLITKGINNKFNRSVEKLSRSRAFNSSLISKIAEARGIEISKETYPKYNQLKEWLLEQLENTLSPSRKKYFDIIENHIYNKGFNFYSLKDFLQKSFSPEEFNEFSDLFRFISEGNIISLKDNVGKLKTLKAKYSNEKDYTNEFKFSNLLKDIISFVEQNDFNNTEAEAPNVSFLHDIEKEMAINTSSIKENKSSIERKTNSTEEKTSSTEARFNGKMNNIDENTANKVDINSEQKKEKLSPKKQADNLYSEFFKNGKNFNNIYDNALMPFVYKHNLTGNNEISNKVPFSKFIEFFSFDYEGYDKKDMTEYILDDLITPINEASVENAHDFLSIIEKIVDEDHSYFNANKKNDFDKEYQLFKEFVKKIREDNLIDNRNDNSPNYMKVLEESVTDITKQYFSIVDKHKANGFHFYSMARTIKEGLKGAEEKEFSPIIEKLQETNTLFLKSQIGKLKTLRAKNEKQPFGAFLQDVIQLLDGYNPPQSTEKPKNKSSDDKPSANKKPFTSDNTKLENNSGDNIKNTLSELLVSVNKTVKLKKEEKAETLRLIGEIDLLMNDLEAINKELNKKGNKEEKVKKANKIITDLKRAKDNIDKLSSKNNWTKSITSLFNKLKDLLKIIDDYSLLSIGMGLLSLVNGALNYDLPSVNGSFEMLGVLGFFNAFRNGNINKPKEKISSSERLSYPKRKSLPIAETVKDGGELFTQIYKGLPNFRFANIIQYLNQFKTIHQLSNHRRTDILNEMLTATMVAKGDKEIRRLNEMEFSLFNHYVVLKDLEETFLIKQRELDELPDTPFNRKLKAGLTKEYLDVQRDDNGEAIVNKNGAFNLVANIRKLQEEIKHIEDIIGISGFTSTNEVTSNDEAKTYRTFNGEEYVGDYVVQALNNRKKIWNALKKDLYEVALSVGTDLRILFSDRQWHFKRHVLKHMSNDRFYEERKLNQLEEEIKEVKTSKEFTEEEKTSKIESLINEYLEIDTKAHEYLRPSLFKSKNPSIFSGFKTSQTRSGVSTSSYVTDFIEAESKAIMEVIENTYKLMTVNFVNENHNLLSLNYGENDIGFRKLENYDENYNLIKRVENDEWESIKVESYDGETRTYKEIRDEIRDLVNQHRLKSEGYLIKVSKEMMLLNDSTVFNTSAFSPKHVNFFEFIKNTGGELKSILFLNNMIKNLAIHTNNVGKMLGATPKGTSGRWTLIEEIRTSKAIMKLLESDIEMIKQFKDKTFDDVLKLNDFDKYDALYALSTMHELTKQVDGKFKKEKQRDIIVLSNDVEYSLSTNLMKYKNKTNSHFVDIDSMIRNDCVFVPKQLDEAIDRTVERDNGRNKFINTTQTLKGWILLNPINVSPYILRNITGEVSQLPAIVHPNKLNITEAKTIMEYVNLSDVVIRLFIHGNMKFTDKDDTKINLLKNNKKLRIKMSDSMMSQYFWAIEQLDKFIERGGLFSTSVAHDFNDFYDTSELFTNYNNERFDLKMGKGNVYSKLANHSKLGGKKIVGGYKKFFRKIIDHTSLVFKFGAYLKFLNEINNNEGKLDFYYASNERFVKALKPLKKQNINLNEIRAMQLAQDCFLNYSAVSQGDEALANYVFPFWRFEASNFRSKTRQIVNTMKFIDKQFKAINVMQGKIVQDNGKLYWENEKGEIEFEFSDVKDIDSQVKEMNEHFKKTGRLKKLIKRIKVLISSFACLWLLFFGHTHMVDLFNNLNMTIAKENTDDIPISIDSMFRNWEHVDELQKDEFLPLRILVPMENGEDFVGTYTFTRVGVQDSYFALMGMHDASKDLEMFMRYQQETDMTEAFVEVYIKQNAKQFLNQRVQAINPLYKMVVEMAIQKSLFPDVFNPRPLPPAVFGVIPYPIASNLGAGTIAQSGLLDVEKPTFDYSGIEEESVYQEFKRRQNFIMKTFGLGNILSYEQLEVLLSNNNFLDLSSKYHQLLEDSRPFSLTEYTDKFNANKNVYLALTKAPEYLSSKNAFREKDSFLKRVLTPDLNEQTINKIGKSLDDIVLIEGTNAELVSVSFDDGYFSKDFISFVKSQKNYPTSFNVPMDSIDNIKKSLKGRITQVDFLIQTLEGTQVSLEEMTRLQNILSQTQNHLQSFGLDETKNLKTYEFGMERIRDASNSFISDKANTLTEGEKLLLSKFMAFDLTDGVVEFIQSFYKEKNKTTIYNAKGETVKPIKWLEDYGDLMNYFYEKFRLKAPVDVVDVEKWNETKSLDALFRAYIEEQLKTNPKYYEEIMVASENNTVKQNENRLNQINSGNLFAQ